MTDREKLIERLRWWAAECDRTNFGCQARNLLFEAADEIANGVTGQNLDGCEYCNNPHPARDCVLPNGLERILVVYDDGSFLGKPFVNHREIKFCPMCGLRVSQPPKGETNEHYD